MASPFDDPDLQKFMADNGIVHRPGLAQEHLEKIAPLLRAEGFDPDNLDFDDIDDFNAALGRANEQHNLMLFSPSGVHRTQVLGFLRRYTEAVSEGDDARAQRLLEAIEPDETDEKPAASHVIGVSSGLLDTWFADADVAPALSRSRVRAEYKQVRAAATDLLALARKHRAFDSTGSLIVRYGGEVVMDASAAAVAAAIAAVAGSGQSVSDVCRRLLISDDDLSGVKDVSVGQRGSGSAFMKAPPAPSSDVELDAAAENVLHHFGHWLERQDDIAAVSIDDEVGMLGDLLGIAQQGGPDLTEPAGLDEFVDFVIHMGESDEPESAGASRGILEILHDFVHFSEETGAQPTEWIDVHDRIDDAIFGPEGSAMLDGLFDAIPEVDEHTALQALARTRVVTAVPDVLEWIGERHKVSQGRSLRRADIHDVAAMLDLSTIGAASRVDPVMPLERDFGKPLPEPSPRYVQSMWEDRVLSAWWEALETADIITVNTSSVRPGPNASAFTPGAQPSFEVTQLLVGAFLSFFLLHDVRRSDDYFATARTSALIRHLLAGAAPEQADRPDVDLTTPVALQQLVRLEKLGFLSLDPTYTPAVPVALRPTVIRATLAAIAGQELDGA